MFSFSSQLRGFVEDTSGARVGVGTVESIEPAAISVRVNGSVVQGVRPIGNPELGKTVYLMTFPNGDVVALAAGTISAGAGTVTSTTHTHDGRYYTRAEIDSALQGKAAAGHTHPAPLHIMAITGRIGGFSIDETSMTAGSGSSFIGLDVGGTNPALYIGSVTPASAPFRVTMAGAMTASNADVTGVIRANTGYIGGATGWTISSNELSTSSSTNRIRAVSTALNSNDTGFFLQGDGQFRIGTVTGGNLANGIQFLSGAIQIASANFSLSSAGNITATGGTIGGFTIGASTLTGGTLSLNSSGLIQNAYAAGLTGYQLAANGDAEFNNITARGAFKVATFHAGAVTATNGSVIVPKSVGTVRAAFTSADAGGGGSAPAIVNTTSAGSGGNTTSLACNVPSGTLDGHVMYAFVACRGDAQSITPPAGWTSVNALNNTNPSPDMYGQAFVRVAASEPANYTWTSAVSQSLAIIIVTLSGVDTAAPTNAQASQANAASTSLTAPSITTTVNNCRLLMFGAINSNTQTITPPGTMTEQVERTAAGTSGLAIELATEAFATAGSTGTRVGTISASQNSSGWLIAVAPGGGGTFQIQLNDPEGVTHANWGSAWTAHATTGDVIRLREGVGTAVQDLWGRVVSKTDNTTYWTLTVSKLSPGDGTNYTFQKGAAVLNYGAADQGIITISADGTIGASPNISMFTHAGSPHTTVTPLLRIGNLNGWGNLSGTKYGWGVGRPGTDSNYAYYTAADGLVVKGVINADSGYLANLSVTGTLDMQSTGTIRTASSGARIVMSNATYGGLIGYGGSDTYDPSTGSGTYQIRWDKTTGALYAGAGGIILDSTGVSAAASANPADTQRNYRFTKGAGGTVIGRIGGGYAAGTHLVELVVPAITDEESYLYLQTIAANGSINRFASVQISASVTGTSALSRIVLDADAAGTDIATVEADLIQLNATSVDVSGGINLGTGTGAGTGGLNMSGSIRQSTAIAARLHRTTTFTHNSTGNWLAVSFDQELHDSAALHSTVTNTSRLTAPVAGFYVITGSFIFASNSTGLRQIGIRHGGATFVAVDARAPISGGTTPMTVTAMYYLAANEYVELMAWQSSGGDLDIAPNNYYSCEFAMARVP